MGTWWKIDQRPVREEILENLRTAGAVASFDADKANACMNRVEELIEPLSIDGDKLIRGLKAQVYAGNVTGAICTVERWVLDYRWDGYLASPSCCSFYPSS